MPERKSSRARKSVDYARFGADGELDDDDFADSTPPMSKRPKLANKENVEKKAEKTLARKEPKKRSAVEERLFERELQAALELSMSQSDPSQESEVKRSPSQEAGVKISLSQESEVKNPGASSSQSEAARTTEEEGPPNIVGDTGDDNRAPSPILPRIDNPPVLARFSKSDSDIEVLEENVDEVPSSRRRSSKKQKKYIDSDSESGDADFEVDLRQFLKSPLTPKVQRRKRDDDTDFAMTGNDESDNSDDDDDVDDDSDDDFNEDDSDDDFGVPKKKIKKNSTSTPKPAVIPKPAVAQTAAKTTKTNTAKPIASKPAVSISVKPSPARTVPRPAIVKSPAVMSPAPRVQMAGVTKKTNWTPPASSGNAKSSMAGVMLKSPSTGLRIGLSRNMKLKPLHPNLKLPN